MFTVNLVKVIKYNGHNSVRIIFTTFQIPSKSFNDNYKLEYMTEMGVFQW